MERVRVGEAALLMYAAATYVPQSIFHALNEEALTERFRIDPGMQPLALFIVAFLLLALLLNELLPRVRTGNGRLARIMAHVFESPANILLGVLLIVLAANFYATEGISFRQTGEHLSEAGAAVQLLMLCKPYVYAWTVYHLVRIIRGRNLGNARARCVGVLFLASLVLSITGAFDVIPLVWCAAFVTCSSRRVRAIFLIMRRRRPLWQRLALLILGIPAAAAVVATMIWLGYANKMGGEQTLELFRRIGVEEIAEQVMVRASTSYASTVSFAEHNLANASLYESALRVPLEVRAQAELTRARTQLALARSESATIEVGNGVPLSWISGHWNSFQVATKVSRPSTASAGRMAGSTMLQYTRMVSAPSIRADSTSSSGTACRMNCRM